MESVPRNIARYIERLDKEELWIMRMLQNTLVHCQSIGSSTFPVNIDWMRCIQLIERHRLIPVAYTYLKEINGVPEAYIRLIHQKYEENTRNMLGLASEMVSIFSMFSAHGLNFIALKGPLLAKMAYGDFNLRQSRDIDLLIRPGDLAALDALLKEQGYQRISPDFTLTEKQFRVNQVASHEYSYKHPQKGNLVELHWRLFTQRLQFTMNEETLFSHAENFPIADKSVKVLNPHHMLLYLLVHGSVHSWFRLFWLRDIAHLMNRERTDFGQLLEDSRKYGLDRSVIQGLILSHILLKTDIPQSILNFCHSDKPVQKLVSSALHAITSSEGFNVSSKLSRIHKPFYLMRLRREWSYKFNCLYKLRTNASDWRTIRLPDSLFFLYYVLRPFTWFYNAYLHSRKKSQH